MERLEVSVEAKFRWFDQIGYRPHRGGTDKMARYGIAVVICVVVLVFVGGCSAETDIVESIYSPPVSCVDFWHDGEEVGKLCWNDKVFTFDGDADEAAKVFFNHVRKHINEWIDYQWLVPKSE